LSLGSVHTTSYPAWLDKVSTLGGIGISGILAKNKILNLLRLAAY
jgi:hypothetical protein